MVQLLSVVRLFSFSTLSYGLKLKVSLFSMWPICLQIFQNFQKFEWFENPRNINCICLGALKFLAKSLKLLSNFSNFSKYSFFFSKYVMNLDLRRLYDHFSVTFKLYRAISEKKVAGQSACWSQKTYSFFHNIHIWMLYLWR
jgi:hypothetical protein